MSGTPAYRKLHQRLRDDILAGRYEVGGLLPSENQLSKQHKINRMTVRHALNELVHEGLIKKQPGKGSIVTATRKTLGLLSFKGFSEVMGRKAMDAMTTDLQPAGWDEWPNPFFYALSQREMDAGCVRLNRLRSVEEDPVMLEYTFVPNLSVPKLAERLQPNGSLFQTLQTDFQIEVETLEQDIQAIKASEREAMYLKIAVGEPILHLFRRYGTSKKNLFIYSSLYCNTEKFTIGNTF
ncbi:MAG: GntR family transcriptional regulator [Bacteroidota bacterium]